MIFLRHRLKKGDVGRDLCECFGLHSQLALSIRDLVGQAGHEPIGCQLTSVHTHKLVLLFASAALVFNQILEHVLDVLLLLLLLDFDQFHDSNVLDSEL